MRPFILILFSTLWLFAQGVDFYSKKFLDTPYGFSPLGEGFGQDKDPRIRTDLFDCTTYVETVLAYSKNPKKPLSALDKIRYTGKPDFYNRRHFPFFWIDGLIKDGFLKPFHSQYDQTITKRINKAVWANREPKFLKDFDTSNIPNRTYILTYIPFNELLKVSIRVPLVFSLVREDRETSPILITHQGFFIPTKNGIIVRHARSKPIGKTVEEPLEEFIERVSSYKKWRSLGVNLTIPDTH